MFDKENCKREVFRKYQEELNKKITFRKRTKRILMTAVSCVSIILVTTTVIYTKNKLYEKDINEKTHTLNPGKIYDGDQTANIVENKIVNNNSSVNNKEENIINEVENNNSQINYEPTSEFFKLLKIVDLTSGRVEINEENQEIIRKEEYSYYIEEGLRSEDEITKNYYKVEKQNSNLVITIRETELISPKNIEFNKNYVISNVNAEDVETIFYATYGQDFGYALLIVYLIQKDGTVKGIDVTNGLNEGYFVADNIAGLENVERLENANHGKPNDSGSETVVAFTKDNKIYELDESEYIIRN